MNYEYLSDLEKEKIVAFNNDPILKNAVKKTILAGIYGQGVLKPGEDPQTMRNWALSLGATTAGISDQDLGQNLRAYSWALNNLESAFKQLEKIVVEVPKPEDTAQKNPAL